MEENTEDKKETADSMPEDKKEEDIIAEEKQEEAKAEEPVAQPVQEKKKGFFEKIKEKFSKKKEETPESKGFFEKIREKVSKKKEETPENDLEEIKPDEIKKAVEEGSEEEKAESQP
jgi:hypothetical protein